MFFILFLFMGTSVLLSSNQVLSDDPMIIQEEPANGSMYVSVYLSEVRFTVTGDTIMEYAVTSYPDFTGGIQSGIADPGETIHILRHGGLLAVETTYVWWVNLTDGVTWLNTSFSFSTGRDVFQGYTLLTPMNTQPNATYLIDKSGSIVHRWETTYSPCYGVYLMENGSILRPYMLSTPVLTRGVQKITWDGTVTWDYLFSGENFWQTHDVAPLPNGNILILALERKNATASLVAGRNSSLLVDGELWPVFIVEVHPTGLTSGNVVWEWHLWDHLIQEYDPTKQNYGRVGEHPELLDLNYMLNGKKDWIHPNTLHYNPQLDQIIICSRHIGEFWIIDHSTTTEEAAGHTGGVHARGGDFLYRWGNPQVYRAGDASDQRLFGPHDSQWISSGYPGEGNILVFNNGWGRTGGNYSSVLEITPPVDREGNYRYIPGAAFEPGGVTWEYTAPDPYSFYARFISGCERLPNGNTLICDGPVGRLFEVTKNNTIVWSYNSSVHFPGSLVFRARRYYEPFAPPTAPQITGPQSIARDVSANFTIISWDPDEDPVYYYVDWGDNTTGHWIGPYQSGKAISLSHVWGAENIYPIRIRAKDLVDSTSILSWVNISVGFPNQPDDPSPSQGATEVDIHSNMSWAGGDPDMDDLVTYDVYFGIDNPPPKRMSNQSSVMFHPGTLQYGMRYYWRVVSWDKQGMSATGPLWDFTTEYDITPPATLLHRNGTLGNEGWFVTPVMITFEAQDTQSGLNATWYKIDDSPWIRYSLPVKISQDGHHILFFYSIDAMGNQEQTHMAPVKIDTKDPLTTYTVSGVLGNNGWYLSNVTMAVSALDNESGVSSIYYQLNAEGWNEYTTPLVITIDGFHTLRYYSVDIAGNTQQIQAPFSFKIDQTAPLVNLTVTAQNLLHTQWLMIVNISDGVSGVQKVEFYVDDTFLGTRNAPGPYDWYYEGSGHTAYAIGFDNAGNTQTSAHVTSFVIYSQLQFLRFIKR